MYWFIRFSTQWRSRLTRELLLRSICTVRACATWRYRRISPGQCQGMRSLYSCQLRQQLVPGSRALLRQIHTSRSYLKQRLNRRAMRSDGATRSLRISRLVIAATVPTARQAVRAPAAHQNSALHLTKSKSELWALPLIQCARMKYSSLTPPPTIREPRGRGAALKKLPDGFSGIGQWTH